MNCRCKVVTSATKDDVNSIRPTITWCHPTIDSSPSALKVFNFCRCGGNHDGICGIRLRIGKKSVGQLSLPFETGLMESSGSTLRWVGMFQSEQTVLISWNRVEFNGDLSGCRGCNSLPKQNVSEVAVQWDAAT